MTLIYLQEAGRDRSSEVICQNCNGGAFNSMFNKIALSPPGATYVPTLSTSVGRHMHFSDTTGGNPRPPDLGFLAPFYLSTPTAMLRCLTFVVGTASITASIGRPMRLIHLRTPRFGYVWATGFASSTSRTLS